MQISRKPVATLGIDLAKRVFALHGIDAAGHVALRRTVSRGELVHVIARLGPCLIGMESCSGAHEWARQFGQLGHTVRLIAPAFVQPYRKSGKNDSNDAEAICEAVGRPSMRFVAVKTVEQQAVLTVHRARQGYVEERTALINRIRGLMAEFGFVFATGLAGLRDGLSEAIEKLPTMAREIITDLFDHLRYLGERISKYDQRLAAMVRESESARRLQTIPGIGPVTALAIVATVGDAKTFKNGRQFAAWLGLVPKQHSSGGKNRLLGISKRGNEYLRTLLVQGARSTMQRASTSHDRMGNWTQALQARRGYHKTRVAVAAKNARIAWCVLARGVSYEPRDMAGEAAA